MNSGNISAEATGALRQSAWIGLSEIRLCVLVLPRCDVKMKASGNGTVKRLNSAFQYKVLSLLHGFNPESLLGIKTDTALTSPMVSYIFIKKFLCHFT